MRSQYPLAPSLLLIWIGPALISGRGKSEEGRVASHGGEWTSDQKLSLSRGTNSGSVGPIATTTIIPGDAMTPTVAAALLDHRC